MDESSILSRFDDLVRSGAVRYDENQETIRHTAGGLTFRFVLTSALVDKPTLPSHSTQDDERSTQDDERLEVDGERRAGSDISTKGYEIGQVNSTHVLIANKFCYARPHLVLLTCDGHRRQHEPLEKSDLEAAWAVLTSMSSDYVAFYNCGRDGGCSRLHKHMQLLPKPDHSFADFLDADEDEDEAQPAAVPFHWFYKRLTADDGSPAGLVRIYTELLAQATAVGHGLADHADTAPRDAACPHNLILTRRWMIVIPRRQAAVNEEAGVNALGMLGVIVVATKPEVDNWVRQGLTESLRKLGVPK